MALYAELPDAGIEAHDQFDVRLPSNFEKERLILIGDNAPVEVTGARDTPEEALANLLTALETLGLITDSTTAT